MQEEILLGIDFGTTNTVVSIFENNKAKPLCDGIFKSIPSKIGYDISADKIYCGNYIPIDMNNNGNIVIFHSFKMDIGTDKKYMIGINEYTPMDLMIIFFKHIHDIIMKNVEFKIAKTVVTVPSNFNDMQREIIRSCFIKTNFDVIRIINEPSAAALAYGLNFSSQEEEKILVIDTGGGTMDFTILQKTELFFEVVHSEGLNIGGNNFTKLVVDDMKRQKIENISWNQAQRIKEKLTYMEKYENKNYFISRTRFENLSNQLIENVENTLKSIMTNYGETLHYIVLVGGTSRIPILHSTIKEVCNKTPWVHNDLEAVVAEGAALYCGIILNRYTKSDDVVLLDVLPLSLGVELVDGTYSVVIPKNTPLPVKRTQRYTTDSPSDSSVRIKVYQGERTIASKNFLIGEFVFDKISMGGVPIIEISFKVDINSIINVIVIDRKSGVEKSLLIKDIPVLEKEEIENLVNMATKSADMDNIELSRVQHIYLIRTHIENALINMSINCMIDGESKDNMIEYFNKIENELESMNSLQLVEILTELQTKYSILGSAQINDVEIDSMDGVEKMLLMERKEELKNRIELILINNIEWKEFLEPVLEAISYNSCTAEYVDEKLALLNELENMQKDESDESDVSKDYKLETKNLCTYLKSEIESGSINLGNNTNLLIDHVNMVLIMLSEDKDINWEEQLQEINKKCEELYLKSA
jgi:molecular chaperone DnaK